MSCMEERYNNLTRHIDEYDYIRMTNAMRAIIGLCKKRDVPYRKINSKTSESTYIEIDEYDNGCLKGVIRIRFSTHLESESTRWRADFHVSDFKDITPVKKYIKSIYPSKGA